MKQVSETIINLNEQIKKGNWLQVVDIASRNLQKTEDDSYRKPLALAHSRLGHLDNALAVLEPLADKNPDTETLGLLGGIYKRKWIVAQTPELLDKAFHFYITAFNTRKEYWTGINAATLAKLKKDKNADSLANEVLDLCWEEYEKLGTRSSFWLLVSIAEAHLIKGDLASAIRWYKLVTPMAYKTVGQMKTVRRNAKLLVGNLSKEDSEKIMNSIHSPRIAVFAGHRIDRAGAPKRFPQKESETVKRKLKAALGKLRISIGVASLADGADILFHEALLETGRQIRVILPSALVNFREQLALDDPGGWLERFDRIIEAASTIEIVSNSTFKESPSAIYELATDFMIGYANNLAEDFDGELLPLVVWDEKKSEKKGGTYSAVQMLRSIGYEPEIISVFPKAFMPGKTPNLGKTTLNKRPKLISSKVIFAMVDPPKEISYDDEIAENLREFLETTSSLAMKLRIGSVSSAIYGREIAISFESVSDAQVFLFNFKQKHPKCSVFAHIGCNMQFAAPFLRKSDSFSKAFIQASKVVKELATGQIFASTIFKALSSLEEPSCFKYIYSGLYTSDEEDEMEIYEMKSV